MCNCPTRTGLLQIRVTPDEKRLLSNVARKRGVTLSDLIRQTSFEAVQKAQAA